VGQDNLIVLLNDVAESCAEFPIRSIIFEVGETLAARPVGSAPRVSEGGDDNRHQHE
jgi:hypothetical protein